MIKTMIRGERTRELSSVSVSGFRESTIVSHAIHPGPFGRECPSHELMNLLIFAGSCEWALYTIACLGCPTRLFLSTQEVGQAADHCRGSGSLGGIFSEKGGVPTFRLSSARAMLPCSGRSPRRPEQIPLMRPSPPAYAYCYYSGSR